MNGAGRNSFMPGFHWAYFDETRTWPTKCCKEHVKFHENSITGSVADMLPQMDGYVGVFYVKMIQYVITS